MQSLEHRGHSLRLSTKRRKDEFVMMVKGNKATESYNDIWNLSEARNVSCKAVLTLHMFGSGNRVCKISVKVQKKKWGSRGYLLLVETLLVGSRVSVDTKVKRNMEWADTHGWSTLDEWVAMGKKVVLWVGWQSEKAERGRVYIESRQARFSTFKATAKDTSRPLLGWSICWGSQRRSFLWGGGGVRSLKEVTARRRTCLILRVARTGLAS